MKHLTFLANANCGDERMCLYLCVLYDIICFMGGKKKEVTAVGAFILSNGFLAPPATTSATLPHAYVCTSKKDANLPRARRVLSTSAKPELSPTSFSPPESRSFTQYSIPYPLSFVIMVGTRSTRSTRSRPLSTDEITPAELPASPKRSQRKKRLSKVETADLLVAENGEAGRATSWLGGAGDDNMKLGEISVLSSTRLGLD